MVGDFISKTGINLAKIGVAVIVTSVLRESMNETMKGIAKDVNRLKTNIQDRKRLQGS
jgi:hypothetical protein